MKKIVIGAGILIALLVGGFFAFNGYIYQEKQGDTSEDGVTASTLDWKWEGNMVVDDAGHVESDSEFRTLFSIRGSVSSLEDCGKRFYRKTDSAAYVVCNLEYSGENIGDYVISGGDAYTIPNADVATFVAIGSPTDGDIYAKDKNHVYFDGRILENADPYSFSMKCTEGSCVYVDAEQTYNLEGEVVR